MILSTKTKEKIMNVRDYYDRKEQFFNVNFIIRVLKILKQEEAFKEKLEYEFVKDRSYGPAAVENGIIYFNLKLFLKYLKDKVEYNFSNYPQEETFKYYNFMTLWVIFHECSHVWQQKGLEEYPELNRLHRDLCNNSPFSLKNFLKYIHLKINGLRVNGYDCFERQANVDALRELVEMYQDSYFLDFIELQHIFNLSLESNGPSIVHDTLKKFLLEYNYDCTGIPEDLLFEVGMPTSKKYTKKVYTAIDKYCDNELSYKEVMKRIRKN